MCVIFTIKYLIYVLICILHILLKYINNSLKGNHNIYYNNNNNNNTVVINSIYIRGATCLT